MLHPLKHRTEQCDVVFAQLLNLRSRHPPINLENRRYETENSLVRIRRCFATELIPFLIASELFLYRPPATSSTLKSSIFQKSVDRLWSDGGNTAFDIPYEVN